MKEVTAATMSSHHADPSARAALVVKGLEGSWGRKMLRTLHWEEQNLCGRGIICRGVCFSAVAWCSTLPCEKSAASGLV